MTLDEAQRVNLMVRKSAEISLTDFGGLYPAYPFGDRRRKAVCWFEKDTLDRLVDEGVLVAKDGRLVTSKTQDACGASQRDITQRDIYTADGVVRPAAVNHNVSALRKLARRREASGDPILTDAQIEAGELFARDYALSGLGFVATQNYEAVGAGGGTRENAAEINLIRSIDRRRRINEAISCLGPGLDRALIAVCCENWSLEKLEKTETWSRNTGKTILKMALDRLVKFYGTQPGERADRRCRARD